MALNVRGPGAVPFTQGGDHSRGGFGGIRTSVWVQPGAWPLPPGPRQLGGLELAPWAQCSSAGADGRLRGRVIPQAKGTTEPGVSESLQGLSVPPSQAGRVGRCAGSHGACRLLPGSVVSMGRGPPLTRRGLGAGPRAVLVPAWPAPSPGAAPPPWLAPFPPAVPGSRGKGTPPRPLLAAVSGIQAGSHVCLPVALPAARC